MHKKLFVQKSDWNGYHIVPHVTETMKANPIIYPNTWYIKLPPNLPPFLQGPPHDLAPPPPSAGSPTTSAWRCRPSSRPPPTWRLSWNCYRPWVTYRRPWPSLTPPIARRTAKTKSILRTGITPACSVTLLPSHAPVRTLSWGKQVFKEVLRGEANRVF